MNKDIDKIHSVLLIILQEIDRICKKNDIKYFLDWGTLLGSVRHKGFIPWDDDADVAMSREEYNRFYEACKTDLNTEKFYLQDDLHEENYGFTMAKLRLNGTHFIEDFSKDVKCHDGLFIDILVWDKYPPEGLKRKLFILKNRMYHKLILIKCDYCEADYKKTMSFKLVKLLVKNMDVMKLKQKRYKHITKYNNSNYTECFTSDWPTYPSKCEWFERVSDYEFDGMIFPGFADYDAVLKARYGSTYMQLPPESERTVHSKYTVDFGEY